MKILRLVLTAAMLVATAGPLAFARQTPAIGLATEVREFRLENGMLFLIVERKTTPQIASRLVIRAGSALEESGKTGIAHMLEHMMFKGTKNFGTLDLNHDQQLQTQIESAYQQILAEQNKRAPDQDKIDALRTEMARLRAQVQEIYVPQAFSSQLGKNGAVGVNAFTSKDQTQYVTSIPSDMLEQWFAIVSEQLFEPSWREFYVEKEVVQREWAFRYVNNPNGAAWLDLNAAAYAAHPYRSPVIGWQADMQRFNTTDAMAFHAKYYTPANAVCVLVGDLTVVEAKRLAEKYFSRYPAGARSPEAITAEPQQQGPRQNIHYLKGARTPLVRIGFHGPAMGSDDFYAMDALTMILSQGRSARMTQELVNKGRALSAWAYNPDNRFGTLTVFGGSPIETEAVRSATEDPVALREAYRQACADLEDQLLAQVARFRTDLVSATDLARIKKLSRRDFIDRMRSNEDLADTLATLEVQIGWRYLNDYLEKMALVTPAQIQAVAQKYLQPHQRTSVYVIPGGTPDAPPSVYTENRQVGGSAAARLAPPTTWDNISRYPTPDGWKHPLSFDREPEKIRYPAGERFQVGQTPVFFMADRQLPLIDLTLRVKAGAVDVPAHKQGLAALLSASIVRGGTETHPPEAMALVLDENAIRMSISVGEESSSIGLSVLRDDWQTGLALLKQVLTRPRFDDNILQTTKTQMLTGLRRQGGDAQSVASREWTMLQFEGHPYGRDPLAGLETIPRIEKKDLMQFLVTRFTAANMVVAVSGDISREEVATDLADLLQALPQKAAQERDLADPPPTSPLLALIHKPGQVQSQIIMGMRGIRRTHPAYWDLNLLMNVFGGNDSMLYTRLRDDLGLVYSAGFYQGYKWQAGLLMGYIGRKADQTSAAIRETATLMKSLHERVPADQVALKRLDVLNSFVFNVDSPAALVNVYATYALRQEPLDTLEKIQDHYIFATSEALMGLAQKHLDPSRLQIVVVADKTTPVATSDGGQTTLETELKQLAQALGLSYRELPLR